MDTSSSLAPFGSPEVQQLLAAVEHFGDSVVVTSPDLELPGPFILGVNDAFCRMTGYSREAVLGKSPRLLQGLRTDRRVLAELKDCCRRGERFVGEAINYRKNGTEYVVQWSVDPVRGSNGTIVCFVAVQRDVTALRQQRELAEARRQAAVEAANRNLAALTDAVLVLEQTKRSFRSTQLGQLRQRLNQVIEGEARAK